MRGRLSLLAKFALLSGVLLLALGLAVGSIQQRAIRSRTLADARRSATVVATVGIKPFVKPSDLTHGFVPLAPARLAQLDAALKSSLSANGFVRMKLWNRQHWIVYSDNPALLGRWFAGDDLVERSFAGEVSSEITDLSSPEEFEERTFGQLLAVYVPLRVGPDGAFTSAPAGRVVGSFEIYLPYEPIAASITAETRRLWAVLAVGLLVIWLGLYRLVASASRRLRTQAAENEHLALHDALTGLPNRTLFGRRLATSIEAAERDDSTLAVLLLDLDRFKEINDTLGHHHGDAVLRQLGPRLRTALAPDALVARLGGDEVAVLLTGPIDGPEAGAVAERLLEQLERPFSVDGLDLDVRGSIGIALYPEHGTDGDVLLQRAEVAMYEAKARHAGVEQYDPAIDPYSPRRLALATEVRRAVDRRELLLHYQPKLDLATMAVTSVEALLRWEHPQHGLLHPGDFLPAIENTELIRPVTMLVLDMALTQVAAWRRQGLDLAVSVNLPAICAHDRDLPGQVAQALAVAGLPARSLALELTESSLLADPERAAAVLGELHELGVKLSIDDFGTGYASVAHLKQLPVSELKIDQSFVMRMAEAGQDAVIVQFSIDLARTLGLTVVAEGVEDEAVLDRLDELGCDQVQGYFVSRPLPAERLAELVRDFAGNVDRSLFDEPAGDPAVPAAPAAPAASADATRTEAFAPTSPLVVTALRPSPFDRPTEVGV